MLLDIIYAQTMNAANDKVPLATISSTFPSVVYYVYHNHSDLRVLPPSPHHRASPPQKLGALGSALHNIPQPDHHPAGNTGTIHSTIQPQSKTKNKTGKKKEKEKEKEKEKIYIYTSIYQRELQHAKADRQASHFLPPPLHTRGLPAYIVRM